MKNLAKTDKQVYHIIQKETARQQDKLNMIPSENIASKSVMEAVGSVFMNKYAEGQVNARYYEGNENADAIEQLAKDRLRKAFRLPKDWSVTVQALAGANANLSVYVNLLEPGDKILSMYLPDGGHLSHGWSFEPEQTKRDSKTMVYRGGSRKISVVSKYYNIVQYKTDPKTEVFDYDAIEKIATTEKPRLIITGGTAYPREIDYVRVAKIAKKVGAMYMADIAHEAGLIAAGANKSPVGVADIVTFTTHKTFRGPRGAVILSREKYADEIERGVFPTLQGGPFLHSIAGIAVAAGEANTAKFKTYARQIVKNAQVLAAELTKYGFYVVSGGTDKHLVLLNIVKSEHNKIGAKYIARALDYAGLVLNKNTVPWETGSPVNPSGIRLGTPIVTTRGMKEREMKFIARFISDVVSYLEEKYPKQEKLGDFTKKIMKDRFIASKAGEIKSLCKKFPVG